MGIDQHLAALMASTGGLARARPTLIVWGEGYAAAACYPPQRLPSLTRWRTQGRASGATRGVLQADVPRRTLGASAHGRLLACVLASLLACACLRQPAAAQVVMARAGHACYVEQPARFAELLLEWLAELSGKPRGSASALARRAARERGG
jgi:pimeloyl-ACP methyl ester carboxylesterase